MKDDHVASEERNQYNDVPFLGYENEEEPSASGIATESQKKRTGAPPHGRKTNASPQQVVPSPSSPSDNVDDQDTPLQRVPGVPDTINSDNDDNDDDTGSNADTSDDDSNVDEEDFAELMSQSLPPERRVVEKKVSEGSYTSYRTQSGSWLTYYELKRLANIARNASLIDALGIPEAGSRLTARPGGGHEVRRHVPVVADEDDDYSEAGSGPKSSRSRHDASASVPRAQLPRTSKNKTTW